MNVSLHQSLSQAIDSGTFTFMKYDCVFSLSVSPLALMCLRYVCTLTVWSSIDGTGDPDIDHDMNSFPNARLLIFPFHGIVKYGAMHTRPRTTRYLQERRTYLVNNIFETICHETGLNVNGTQHEISVYYALNYSNKKTKHVIIVINIFKNLLGNDKVPGKA